MPAELITTFANFGLSALLLVGLAWVFYRVFVVPSVIIATEDRAESKRRILGLEARVKQLGEKLEQQDKNERVTLINMSNRLVKVVEENNRVIEDNTYIIKSIYAQNTELYRTVKDLKEKQKNIHNSPALVQ